MYSEKVAAPLLILIILTCMSIFGIAAAVTYPFSVGSTFGDRDMFNFTVTSPGVIKAEATWSGSASGLALILNGPGQVGYYARKDGASPLTLSYTATNADTSQGDTWSISIVNFGGGMASGTLTLTYPGATESSCYSNLPLPNLAMTGTEDYSTASGDFTRYKLAVVNRADYPAALFQPAPDLPPCGSNTNSARAWVNIYDQNNNYIYGFCALSSPADLGNLWFAVPMGDAAPNKVYVIIEDRRCGITYRSNQVSTASTGGATPPGGTSPGEQISPGMENNMDRPGMDYSSFDLASPQPNLCKQTCDGDPNCKAYTYVRPGYQGDFARCWLKNGVPSAVQAECCISGVKAASGSSPGGGLGPQDLTGVWKCDDGGKYYIRQLGSKLWWYGEQNPSNPSWSNVMEGTLSGDTITAFWADVPKGGNMESGELVLNVESPNKIKVVHQTGGFGGSSWSRST
jgi:hypothetical protein